LLAVFQGLLSARYWEPVRHIVFDTYQHILPRRVEQFHVAIIDIDEASVAALGQWPWPRTRLARLLEATHQLGALAVGLDMIMPEVDRLSPSMFIAERPDISPGLQRELAVLPANDTIRRDPTSDANGRAGWDASKLTSGRVDDQTPVIHGETPLCAKPWGYVTNIPRPRMQRWSWLSEHGAGQGCRGAPVPLLVAAHGELAPMFGLELLRGCRRTLYSVQLAATAWRASSDTFIPTDPDGRRRVYFSKGRRFCPDIYTAKRLPMPCRTGRYRRHSLGLIRCGDTRGGHMDAGVHAQTLKTC
jgi:adenylate cyclase